MQGKVEVAGLKDLEKKLFELKSATAKNKMRKVLRESGEPIARRMRSKVSVDKGHLKDSIDVSARLNKSQRRQQRKGSFADVEMHIGPGGHVQGITEEFGTVNQPPDPFARPAWHGHEMDTLDDIGGRIWVEVNKKARGRGR